jgi:hypothetical protein
MRTCFRERAGTNWAVAGTVDDAGFNAADLTAAGDFAVAVLGSGFFFFFFFVAAVVEVLVLAPQISTAVKAHRATAKAIPNRRMYSP